MERILLSAILVALLVKAFSQRWLVDALIEAINNFRGGPPTPMHPSAVNDGAFLKRRSQSRPRRP